MQQTRLALRGKEGGNARILVARKDSRFTLALCESKNTSMLVTEAFNGSPKVTGKRTGLATYKLQKRELSCLVRRKILPGGPGNPFSIGDQPLHVRVMEFAPKVSVLGDFGRRNRKSRACQNGKKKATGLGRGKA